jgi:subtilisin family serine protease
VYTDDVGPVSIFGCRDATTAADQVTCFTNSNSKLELMAPGAPITSTGVNGGTSTFYGTSQASPHAAGGAALLLEANPGLMPQDIRDVLSATGVPVTDPKNGLTFPRINLLDAISTVIDQ